MPEKYTKIDWVPKRTLDKEKNILYIDHTQLVKEEKEVIVYSPKEKADIVRKALKNYKSSNVFSFKPGPREVHIFHTPSKLEEKL